MKAFQRIFQNYRNRLNLNNKFNKKDNDSRAIQWIYFTSNLDGAAEASMFLFLGEAKETKLDSQATLKFCKSLSKASNLMSKCRFSNMFNSVNAKVASILLKKFE